MSSDEWMEDQAVNCECDMKGRLEAQLEGQGLALI